MLSQQLGKLSGESNQDDYDATAAESCIAGFMQAQDGDKNPSLTLQLRDSQVRSGLRSPRLPLSLLKKRRHWCEENVACSERKRLRVRYLCLQGYGVNNQDVRW